MNTTSSWFALVLATHVHTQTQVSLQMKSEGTVSTVEPRRSEYWLWNLLRGRGRGRGGRKNPTAGLFLDLLRVAESKLLVL